jgi:hypothetical protein
MAFGHHNITWNIELAKVKKNLEKEIEEQKMFYKEKVNKLLGEKEINNVYLEKLLEDLLESIRGAQYSMISEESTDIEEDMRAVDEATDVYMDHLKQLLERTETVQLGQFEVSSRTLIVGDPMYIHHDYEHLIQEIHSCKKGRWNAHILTVNTTDGEKICHQLIMKHETEMIDEHNYKWLKVGYISVDGGRAGIFNNMPLINDTPVIESKNNLDGYMVNTGASLQAEWAMGISIIYRCR